MNAWYDGGLTGSSNTAATYNPTNSSANLPNGAVLTPGAANFVDTTPPSVTSQINFDTAPQNILFSFSEKVAPNFTVDDITLTQTSSPGFDVPSANLVLTPTTGNNYQLTFQNYPNNVLPDGRYHLVIHAAGVTDTSNNAMAADYPIDFTFLKGDANQDGVVNALDFNALATNFGQSGTFSHGDFDYSGTIDTNDFTILAQQFNKVLPASAVSLAMGTATLFSTQKVGDGNSLLDLLSD